MAEENMYGEDIIDGLTDENAKLFRERCNCLPACMSIEYGADIDRAKYDIIAALNSYNMPTDHYAG